MTGPAAAYGIDGEKGIELARAHLASGDHINGNSIQFEIEDSGGDPATAVMLARRFADDSRVVAILGPTRTSEAVAVSRVLQDKKIPVISVGSTGDWQSAAGTGFGPWMFRSTRVDSTIVRPLLAYLQRGGANSLGILYSSDDSWSDSITQVYRKVAPEIGMKITFDESIPTGDPNRTPQLLKLKLAHPDAVIINLLAEDAPAAVSQAREMGITSRFAGTAGFTNQSTWSLAKPGSLDGVIVGDNFYSGSPRPPVLEFVKTYQDRYHTSPPPYAAYAYDGARILVDAIERCGGCSNRDEIRRLIGSTTNFEGVLGVLTYHGSGDAEKTPVLMRIAGDKYEIVN